MPCHATDSQTLIRDLDDTISALEPHQVLVFYEAVGCMIAAEKDASRQMELLAATMQGSNKRWRSHLQAASAAERLQTMEAMSWIINFLRTNSAICRSLKVGGWTGWVCACWLVGWLVG